MQQFISSQTKAILMRDWKYLKHDKQESRAFQHKLALVFNGHTTKATILEGSTIQHIENLISFKSIIEVIEKGLQANFFSSRNQKN